MTPIKRARVHRGECRDCREGQGQEGQHKTGSSNTGWSQRFDTYAEADAFMRTEFAAFTDTGACRRCKPQEDAE